MCIRKSVDKIRKQVSTDCIKCTVTYWLHLHSLHSLIVLDIDQVWSESSLCAQWVAKDPRFLHADSKDSDQTGQMPRLIWVFTGRTCHFVGFVMSWPIAVSSETLCSNFHFHFNMLSWVSEWGLFQLGIKVHQYFNRFPMFLIKLKPKLIDIAVAY